MAFYSKGKKSISIILAVVIVAAGAYMLGGRRQTSFSDPKELALYIYGEYEKFESGSQSASRTIDSISKQTVTSAELSEKTFLAVDEDNEYSFAAVKEMKREEISSLLKLKGEKLSQLKLDSKTCYYLLSDDKKYIYRFIRAYKGNDGYITDNLSLGISFYDDLQTYKIFFIYQSNGPNLSFKTPEFIDHYQGSFDIDSASKD